MSWETMLLWPVPWEASLWCHCTTTWSQDQCNWQPHHIDFSCQRDSQPYPGSGHLLYWWTGQSNIVGRCPCQSALSWYICHIWMFPLAWQDSVLSQSNLCIQGWMPPSVFSPLGDIETSKDKRVKWHLNNRYLLESWARTKSNKSRNFKEPTPTHMILTCCPGLLQFSGGRASEQRWRISILGVVAKRKLIGIGILIWMLKSWSISNYR